MYVGTRCLGDIYSQVQFLTEFSMHITGLTRSFRQRLGKKRKEEEEEEKDWKLYDRGKKGQEIGFTFSRGA